MNIRSPVGVVHVSSAHPYTDNRIHYRECRTLAEAGYNVSLIAVESAVNGPDTPVQVTTIPKRNRLARVLLSTYQVVSLALKTRAQVVHLHDPELIPFISILRMAGRQVVYDAHEDLPIQVLGKPYVTRGGRRMLAGLASGFVFLARGANVVVAATETIARRFPPEKTVLVRNYPPLRVEEEEQAEARDDIAVYIGGLAKSRGTLELLQAAEHSAFPAEWTLHLAGPVAADVREFVTRASRTERVVYHGQLAPELARDLLLRAKVGLVTLRNTPAYRDSLPTKMFEYFAAGLPVVASDFPIWREIIEEAEAGFLVDETDPEDIAKVLKYYAEWPDIREHHAAKARRAATARLNWKSEAETLLEAYTDLLDS